MNVQQFARKIEEILKRLDALEATAHISYSKGTFTPTLTGSTVAGVTTYVVQQGTYRRLGSRVDYTLTMQWSAVTGTGNPRIGGLPFASANVSNQNFSSAIWHTTVTFANGDVNVLFSPNVTQLRLFSPATNVGTTELVMEATGLVVISGTYFV